MHIKMSINGKHFRLFGKAKKKQQTKAVCPGDLFKMDFAFCKMQF